MKLLHTKFLGICLLCSSATFAQSGKRVLPPPPVAIPTPPIPPTPPAKTDFNKIIPPPPTPPSPSKKVEKLLKI